MTGGAPSLHDRYRAACVAHVAGGGETTLEQAYTVGREASLAGLGVLDLAALHHETLEHVLRGATAPGDRSHIVRAAAEFFAESLAPFEMTRRGFTDAAARLRGANEQLQAVLDNSPAIISVKDSQYRYTLVNSELERFFHRPRAELLGRTDDDLLPPEAAAEIRAADRDVLEKSVVVQRDDVFPREGLPRTLVSIKFPLRDATGRPYAVCTISTDMTDRLAAEERARAAEAAERANRAKSEFMSHMSHELRTPLNAILGFGQLLEMGELDAPQAANVAEILNSGRHLLGLIEDLLDVSRVEAGTMAISLEPLEPHLIIGELVSLVAPLAASRSVRILVGDQAGGDPAGDQRRVLADRRRIKQVLLNLVSNAVKYSPAGASVRIAVEPGASRRVRILVADTGPGIPEDKRAWLFTPFERLGAERSQVEGTGLGLALSKGLVELMGGTLGVESVPGQGSTFWLELPQARRPGAAQDGGEGDGELSRPAAGAMLGPCTIACVEDNPANLRLVERAFEAEAGVRLVTADAGEAAVQLVREHSADLVLLDLHLPDIPGEEVLARLRHDEVTRDVPVVVLSADASESRIQRLIDAGADDYLTKPLDVKRFLDTVRRHVAAAQVR